LKEVLPELKVGLEIHQQLETKKLFCECESKIKIEKPDIVIRRRLKAVSGEKGETDIAASAEEVKGLEFEYEFYNDCGCLVELDEEPPHRINEEALRTSLEIALLLNMCPVDEIQIMRKTVVDGSNTSGFQRTGLVATDGFIETKEGKVRVEQLNIEEDAARIIERKSNSIVFRLDRLGIPLIELGTKPDIKTPEQALETAQKIGLILRSSKVRRGLGTIRQDINISIKDGARVEIKGAQDLKLIPELIKTEALRQKNLIELKKELKKRDFKSVKADIQDLTLLFKETGCNFVKNSLNEGKIVVGFKVPKFKGLFKKYLFGKEIAGYAKALGNVSGLIHSDELPNYGISEKEVKEISKKLEIKDDDAFVFIVGKGVASQKALEIVCLRINNSLNGVLKEVRKAEPDGTTSFIRPMPGEARMYPETDVPPSAVTKELVLKIKKNLPEKPEQKLKRYIKQGLNDELAYQLLHSEYSRDFDEMLAEFKNIKPVFLAQILIAHKAELRKRYSIEDIDFRILRECLELLNKEDITKDILYELMAESAEKKQSPAVLAVKFKGANKQEIEKKAKEVIEKNKDKKESVIMGILMNEFKGRISGKELAEIVKKFM